MYLGDERRQHTRYRAGNISVTVSFRDKSSGNIYVESVQAFDFNSSGIAIETNLEFEQDNPISLNISQGGYHASNIICKVIHVLNRDNKNRYGLQFDYAANEHMYDEVEEILTNIERGLSKKQKLPSRRNFRLKKSIERRRRIKIIGR
jgi:hypothetical protein